jgi:hypothetical protein
VELEQLAGMLEEGDASPVAPHVVGRGHRQERLLAARASMIAWAVREPDGA